MKATGIIRRVDDLGRLVIPKSIRRPLGIGEGDPLEISIKGDTIVLRKYEVGCQFCGNVEIESQESYGNNICPECVNDIETFRKQIKRSLKP